MRWLAVSLIIIAVAIVAGRAGVKSDGYSGLRSLARAEAFGGKATLGGNCRVINTLAALETPGSYIVYGTIRDSNGEYRHLWAIDSRGQIIDKSCPPERAECGDRGYRGIVRVSDMAVVWTAPGDSSWKDSHAYTTEFVTAYLGRTGHGNTKNR